jgi:short-subunit dehydrogenase
MQKIALITGASSGIGRELARIHAEKGGDLVIVARSREQLEQLQSELEDTYSVNVRVIVKDLRLPNSPKEIYDEVKAAGIEIDYLINNAGFGWLGKFHERDLETDLNIIHVNIVALTALTRFFLPDFIKRNTGKILNVSSTASLVPGPLQAVYYASKAYVTSFSNAIAEELSDTNITVTALLPGPTETQFAKISGMEKSNGFKNMASARSVAEDGYDGMMKGKLDVISGITFMQKLLLLTVPFSPKSMVLKQARKFQEES